MKRLIFFTLGMIFALSLFSQNGKNTSIIFTIIKAEYQANKTMLSLDISVKNNSDSIIYIIKPKPYFFKKHYPKRDELGRHGLLKHPYDLVITGKKNCRAEFENDFMAMEDGSQIKLLPKMVKIEPKTEKTFNNININRNDASFCKRTGYKIEIGYKPEVNIFENYELENINKQYDLIKKETKTLNRMLTYSAKEYHSIEKDNFKKLNELITIELPLMKRLNGKNFISNTFIAIEIE